MMDGPRTGSMPHASMNLEAVRTEQFSHVSSRLNLETVEHISPLRAASSSRDRGFLPLRWRATIRQRTGGILFSLCSRVLLAFIGVDDDVRPHNLAGLERWTLFFRAVVANFTANG